MPTLCEIKQRLNDLRQERDELRVALDRSEQHAVDNKAILRNANAEIERQRIGIATLTENRDELARENKRLKIVVSHQRAEIVDLGRVACLWISAYPMAR